MYVDGKRKNRILKKISVGVSKEDVWGLGWPSPNIWDRMRRIKRTDIHKKIQKCTEKISILCIKKLHNIIYMCMYKKLGQQK